MSETNQRKRSRNKEAGSAFRINGRRFMLDRRAIVKAVQGTLPEPIHEHYVVVEGRRYPPKQVISLVTGLDRADFTTHHARRILLRLGFPGARRSHAAHRSAVTARPGSQAARRGPFGGSQADALRPYIDQWVATRANEVLVGAESAREVVSWLARHGQTADSIFRVPESEAAAGGLAPL